MAGRLFFREIGLLFVAFFKNTVSEMPGVVKPMKQQIGITVCIHPGCYFLYSLEVQQGSGPDALEGYDSQLVSH